MKESQLLVFTLIAVGIGFASGILLRQFDLSDNARNLVGFPGEIFMQVLKLMVLPLIFSSLISCEFFETVYLPTCLPMYLRHTQKNLKPACFLPAFLFLA